MPKALLIIDFQNDFTSGGALAVPGGDEIAETVQRLAASLDHVVATRDWHPLDHASFNTRGGRWPVHCVKGTHGAELHPALAETSLDAVVDAGRGRDDEGFSKFEKSPLASILRERGVDEVYICGLATDYCVRASALAACQEGFNVTVVEDAVRAIDVQPGDGQRALEELTAAGAQLATSDEILGSTRAT